MEGSPLPESVPAPSRPTGLLPRLAALLCAAALLAGNGAALAEDTAQGPAPAAALVQEEGAPDDEEGLDILEMPAPEAAAPGQDAAGTAPAQDAAKQAPAAEAGGATPPQEAAAPEAPATAKGDGAGAAAKKDAAGEKKAGANTGEELEKRKKLWPSVDSMTTSPYGAIRSVAPLVGMGTYGSHGTYHYRPRTHSGIDLRAHLGWPVCALRGGKVIRQGPRGAAGITVEILQDDGRRTAYAHLQRSLVTEGQVVARGEHIGLVGCTGRTTGAHLHLSMKEKGSFINPRPAITGLWELFDPPLEELGKSIDAQSCAGAIRYGSGPANAGVRGRGNPRVRGTAQYRRMRKALLDAEKHYKVPDIVTWESMHRKKDTAGK